MKIIKKISVNMELTGKIGEQLLLKIEYQNFRAYAKAENVALEALLPNLTTEENIYTQLSKLNNTPYQLGELKLNLDENIFIPSKNLTNYVEKLYQI